VNSVMARFTEVVRYLLATSKQQQKPLLNAPFLKDDKQRNAADAFGVSALGPTPTVSLCG
jgi:hypothetical protein